ncbi:MAG TPA: hypothetical protein VNN76_09960 [Bacteroidota bacterium]|nr:hypothetical protein [Bacteroidota bacterium]
MGRVTTVVVCLMLGCRTTADLPKPVNEEPLPDLRIKKVEYRQLHRQQLIRRSPRDPVLAKLEYEFVLQIENIGQRNLQEPFYISVSRSLNDYQQYLYSHHIRINDEHRLLETGQVTRFVLRVDLDFPPPGTRLSHYPIRFYINTEGPENSTGYPTLRILERNYANNTFELQIRF